MSIPPNRTTINGAARGGGGDTLLQKANGDVPLDGVAFSIGLLEWVHKFTDFWHKYGFKMGRFSIKKIRKLLFKFNNKLALAALHSAA